MAGLRKLLCICLVAAVAALLPAVPAQARLVAILFDTSGSMASRYRLPSFGARLLAATINGTAGFDRVLAMNFNSYAAVFGGAFPTDAILAEYAGRRAGDLFLFDISNDSAHQQMIDTLDRAFRSTDVGTPYGPLEVMLDRIAREVEAAPGGEEVILVVVSDGIYHEETTDFDGKVMVPRMRAAFERYRARISAAGGALRAEYLFIDVDGANAGKVIDQGVRDTFLEVFNEPASGVGASLPGARTVSSPGALWDALVDIIATVSGTDRAAQAAFVAYSGNRITVDSPLTISRMVIVSTAETGAPLPTRRADDLPVAPSDDRRVTVDMDAPDLGFRGAPQRRGQVEHLWFQNGIPAGRYTLDFDAPVTENVFLLFETSAQVDLRIHDANGTEVQAGPDGVRTLYQGSSYAFSSRILDGLDAAGQPVRVDFDDLPATLTMQLTLEAPQGPNTRSMMLDPAADAGTLTWTPATTGDLAAFARASAGILSPASPRLMLRVLDPAPRLELTPLRPAAACTSCGPDEVASPLQAGAGLGAGTGAVRVGEFDVVSDGAIDGALSFAPSDIAPGFELRDQSGRAIDPAAAIPFGRQERRTFSLWRTDPDPDALVRGHADVTLSVAPAAPWAGPAASRETRVLLTPPAISMVLVNVTEPITPGTLDGLRVPSGELLLGNFAAQFSLVDILVPPAQETVEPQASVVSIRVADRFLLDFELGVPDPAAVGFNALDLRPRTRYWCLCWIAAGNVVSGTPRREIALTYDVTHVPGAGVLDVPLQRASARVPMMFPVSPTPAGLSCGLNLLILLLTYMFLRGVWALFTTHRFPRGAHLEIVEHDGRITTRYLDRGNTVWLRAWFAAFTGNPDEVRDVEGLRLQARRNGAILDVSRNTPNWRLDREEGTFTELKTLYPKRTEYKIQWDDLFRSVMGEPRTAHLRRKRR
jgi:hypothetical protein